MYIHKHLHDQPASGPKMNEPPAIKSKYLSRREQAATSLPNYTLAQPFLSLSSSPILDSRIRILRGLQADGERVKSRTADVHACCVFFFQIFLHLLAYIEILLVINK